MNFEDWWKEHMVELNEDYSKTDMEWIAGLAWKAMHSNFSDLIDAAEKLIEKIDEIEDPCRGYHEFTMLRKAISKTKGE